MANERNVVLELIDGPRVYSVPPNYCILELVDVVRTKGGLYLPEGENGSTTATLGKVLFTGSPIGEHWGDAGVPCNVGDYVHFSPGMGYITPIHDGMIVVNYDSIMLVITQVASEDDAAAPEGVYYAPPQETEMERVVGSFKKNSKPRTYELPEPTEAGIQAGPPRLVIDE